MCRNKGEENFRWTGDVCTKINYILLLLCYINCTLSQPAERYFLNFCVFRFLLCYFSFVPILDKKHAKSNWNYWIWIHRHERLWFVFQLSTATVSDHRLKSDLVQLAMRSKSNYNQPKYFHVIHSPSHFHFGTSTNLYTESKKEPKSCTFLMLVWVSWCFNKAVKYSLYVCVCICVCLWFLPDHRRKRMPEAASFVSQLLHTNSLLHTQYNGSK